MINGRGNVSVEKIRLVWQAAEKLGYKVNAKAQSLRQGKDRTIAVLLPGIEDIRYAAMYEVFQSEFVQRGYAVQLFSTHSMETTELSMLSDALNARVSAVITSSCLADAVDRYRAETADLPLVFLQRTGCACTDVMCAGFDPERTGREIGQYLRQHCTREAALRAASAYASRHPCPRLITQSIRSAVTDPGALVYELDYKRLAHRIVKTLCSRLDKETPLPPQLHMKNDGFRTPVSVPVLSEQCLRMLTMASPSTEALSNLLPHLEKTTGIHLELTVLPSLRDVYDVLQTPSRSRYDLIRMDVAWMDELAERLFRPLDQIPFDWDGLLSKVIPELGENYTVSHGTRYCVPYDPSTQLMFYRRDLFTDPTYKRMYFEAYRKELKVPESFGEYNRIAGFFTRSRNPASPIQYGSAVAGGNVVTSPSEFMPRLFEAGGDLLDSRGPAMTVVFINYASHILNSKMSSIAGKLGFAPVPGGVPLLGGGVVGITRDCAHPETACAFLSWLYSDLVAPVFTTLGGLSPCRSAYGNRDINERHPWLSTARRSFPSARRRGNSSYYSNFSELQMENIIASCVRQALLGEIGAEDALRQAQANCEAYFQPNE